MPNKFEVQKDYDEKPSRLARSVKKGKVKPKGEAGPKEHYHRERFTSRDVFDILDEDSID